MLAQREIGKTIFVGNDADMLVHCYVSSTQPLDLLRSKIRGGQDAYGGSICAYCGINFPATIEHYLPKEGFPEFAVCHHNMVPSYSECNSNKSQHWSDGKRRLIIHFYFDDIPTQMRWLSAEVSIISGVPRMNFKIERPAGMSDEWYTLICSHYVTLKLIDRYGARAGEVISEALASVRCGLSMVDVVENFRNYSKSLGRQHGANFWKSVAFDGMANSGEFVEFVLRHAQDT